MSKKQNENVYSYVIIAAIAFLFIGTIFGYLLFPRTEFYEMPKDDPIFVEHNGEGVTYKWNNNKNIYTLYPGIFYDKETDRYYFKSDAGMHTYCYPSTKNGGLPQIPPIKRYYPNEDKDLSTLTVKFTIDKDFESCFVSWCNENLADMFNNITIKCIPEVKINDINIYLNEENLK